MFKRTENIVHRLMEREISRSPPNTNIHSVRKFYENIVPSFTVYDVESPDHYFQKFTNDGQYLICFSWSCQNLFVYRHKWLTFCIKGENSDRQEDLPPQAKKFESYFSLLYSVCLASGSERICKDFFVETECNSFGIFATASSTIPDNDAPVTSGIVPGVPSIKQITLYLVRLADGTVLDRYTFQNDFIHLSYNRGVSMYGDLLAVLSVRYQSIHILQVRESGTFVYVHTIGTYCRDDDELILRAHEQMNQRVLENSSSSSTETNHLLADSPNGPGNIFKKASCSWTNAAAAHCNRPTSSFRASDTVETSREGNREHASLHVDLSVGVPSERPVQTQDDNLHISSSESNLQGRHILGGMKQRLLSFIFRSIWNRNIHPIMKVQLLKRFYCHFQQYANLIILKVQFLDRHHLLIKYGSVDCVVSWNSETCHRRAFFAVYNLDSTEVLGFYERSSNEFMELYENFFDHFWVISPNPPYMRFISSISNSLSAREQLRYQKAVFSSHKSSLAQVLKRTLALSICNSLSPSPYFDKSLFQFDEKLISATERHRPCMEYPIKFISKHRKTLKFKINSGSELNASDGHVKRMVSLMFHPCFPFAITVQQSLLQPPVVNFHFRR